MPDLWGELPNPSVYADGIDISEATTITNVQGVQPLIWLPDIIFPDAVSMTQSEEYIKLYSTGQLRRMQHLILTINQGTMTYEDYPCDTQNITIRYFSFSLTADQLIFQPITPDAGAVNPPVDVLYPVGSTTASFAENPEWRLISTAYEYVNWQLSQGFQARPFGIASFTIARKSEGILSRLVLPVLLIMILCGLSYWATLSDRIATTVTGLLAVAALYIGIVGAIPLVGYLTRLDHFMYAMFYIIFVNTGIHMIVVRLNAKEKGTNWPLRRLSVRVLEFVGRITMIPVIILTYVICFLPTVYTPSIVVITLMLAGFVYIMCSRYLPELKDTLVSTKQQIDEKIAIHKIGTRGGRRLKVSQTELRFVAVMNFLNMKGSKSAMEASIAAAAAGGTSAQHHQNQNRHNHAEVELEMQATNTTAAGSITKRRSKNSSDGNSSSVDFTQSSVNVVEFGVTSNPLNAE